jgi:hypothetical protein
VVTAWLKTGTTVVGAFIVGSTNAIPDSDEAIIALRTMGGCAVGPNLGPNGSYDQIAIATGSQICTLTPIVYPIEANPNGGGQVPGTTLTLDRHACVL